MPYWNLFFFNTIIFPGMLASDRKYCCLALQILHFRTNIINLTIFSQTVWNSISLKLIVARFYCLLDRLCPRLWMKWVFLVAIISSNCFFLAVMLSFIHLLSHVVTLYILFILWILELKLYNFVSVTSYQSSRYFVLYDYYHLTQQENKNLK